MRHVTILVFAVLMAAAAPARAWCEASCLQPSHTESSSPHCPVHESPRDGTLMSAANSDCPTLDAARPVPATLAVSPLPVSRVAPGSSAQHAPAVTRPGTEAPRHPLSVPLRI